MTTAPNQKDLIHLNDMDEQDWRGILAAIIIIGGFLIFTLSVICGHPEWFAPIGILMYAVTDWYFKSKNKGDE